MITAKNWLRNAMSVGMTMKPGIGVDMTVSRSRPERSGSDDGSGSSATELTVGTGSSGRSRSGTGNAYVSGASSTDIPCGPSRRSNGTSTVPPSIWKPTV